MRKLNRRQFLIPTVLLVILLVSIVSCNTYRYADTDNTKRVSYKGTTYLAVDESRDSFYIDILNTWVSKDECIVRDY